MQVNELLHTTPRSNTQSVLLTQCSSFLTESKGFPIVKNLPSLYDNLQRVKVRSRKKVDTFDQVFNEAFEQEHFKLRQRAIFAHGNNIEHDNLTENFYVFPIDGYKFLYSKEVEQSHREYKQVFETIFDQLGEEKSTEILSDLLHFTYSSTKLSEGIRSGAEIIIYGIPYYYAIKVNSYPSYDALLNSIE